jgi:hypothetical protein
MMAQKLMARIVMKRTMVDAARRVKRTRPYPGNFSES